MNERIPRLAFSAPRFKGRVKLELKDAETGRVCQTVETDNYVTEALDRLVNNIAGGTGDISTYIMPVATNALGGVMLFDDTLGDDAAVVSFPADKKLIGYGKRDTNTTDALHGSLTSSQATPDGWQTVWTFGPGQAVGVIKSVCLTNAEASPFAGFAGGGHPVKDTNGTDINESNEDAAVIYNDGETIFYAANGTDDGSNGTGVTTITLPIYRQRLPQRAYKVGDSQDQSAAATLHSTITVHVAQPTNTRFDIYRNSHIYAETCFAGTDASGKAWFFTGCNGRYDLTEKHIFYFSIEYDADLDTWTLDSSGFFEIAGETGNAQQGTVDGNYAYFIGALDGNGKHARLLRVSLSALADVESYDLPNGYEFAYKFHFAQFSAASAGGGLYIQVKTEPSAGSYDVYRGLWNETHGFQIEPEPYVTGTSDATYFLKQYTARNWSTLQGFNHSATDGNYIIYHYPGGQQLMNYRGTVANLSEPVVKTSMHTLTVTYNLINA